MTPTFAWTLFRKELEEILRERRTLLSLLLLPVLMAPGVLYLGTLVARFGLERLEAEPSRIALLGEGHAPRQLGALLAALGQEEALEQILETHAAEPEAAAAALLGTISIDGRLQYVPPERLPLPDARRLLRDLKTVPYDLPGPELSEALGLYDSAYVGNILAGRELPPERLEPLAALGERLRGSLAAGEIDAAVVFFPGFAAAAEGAGQAVLAVLYDGSRDKSRKALARLRKHAGALGAGLTAQRLQALELPEWLVEPVRVADLDVGAAGNALARILPYFIILACFMGVLHAAIDTAAGEKERGTLETLLLTPASRLDLVMGKLAAVTLCGTIAGWLCAASLVVSLQTGLGVMTGGLGEQSPVAAFGATAILVTPLAALFAAVLLAVSFHARSVREAQGHALPLQLLILLPAFFSIVPGTTLDGSLAFVPVVNTSLALRDIWNGAADPGGVAAALASTTLCALLMAVVAAWRCTRDTVLFRA